ncbi:2-hydroxychromene-2-carboxylate isomerase [uncultured Halopseudomonas sp.]|uniref:2-hydroxychromene-2-carboxylate isomerase n=1 Tax=uncultured Halopseudomonas sp. TaxID=2901193 RepID=UPI0030ED6548|tara:strand:- start:23573 stop:24166 length:594 start_codon:yes stop_codon:yes gene_type:complete
MSKQIEFFFDVGSPASYLAWTQLPALAERHDATIVYRPMLLGGVFQATGNQSPANIEAKGAYTRGDFQRFAQRYGVTLNHNPFFPINTLQLMRGAEALRETDQLQPYLTAVFTAMWVDEQDMGQPEVVGKVLAAADFDPSALGERLSDPEVKQGLKETTEEAVRRGVFGAPTIFIDDEMFFGQDRLDFVEEKLRSGS